MPPRKNESPDSDIELARLYALPLTDFTAERNALAARLRKAGKRKEAAEVQGLRKPAASTWAINQLLSREADKIEALLAAGERARTAQRQSLAGRATGTGALREALQEVRSLHEELRGRAVAFLSEAGHAAGTAVVDRLTSTLQALAFDRAAAAAVERGWLTDDLEPPGFEVLAGLQLAAGSVPRPRPRPPVLPATGPARTPERRPAHSRPSRLTPPQPDQARPQGRAPGSSRPQGRAPGSSRPQGRAPQSSRPQGRAPQSSRPQGRAPGSSRPQGRAPGSSQAARTAESSRLREQAELLASRQRERESSLLRARLARAEAAVEKAKSEAASRLAAAKRAEQAAAVARRRWEEAGRTADEVRQRSTAAAQALADAEAALAAARNASNRSG
ncbi:MAG TPA: hypothetical protein VHQ90_25155 [Thermoanaerobaculia bacterium]|nr:hypothetical protein [Thermoanaerobaculia bacterium]